MKRKRIIEIDIDYLRNPIISSDTETGELYTGIGVIDTNEKIKELNLKIGDMYDSNYEFNSHDVGCWFNEEKFNMERPVLLSMLKELINELNSVNDGSYKVVDKATKYIETLYKD